MSEQLVERPWGHFRSLARGEGFQIKRLVVRPGGRLSLQRHRQRTEHWVIVRGSPRITIADSVRGYDAGTHVHIPLAALHRLENPGAEDVVIIEVQLGEYLGEDDIERLDDAYGRA